MAKLTHELLGQYMDGELSPQEMEKIQQAIKSSEDDKRTVDEWSRIGSLLRMMDEETTADVSFEGLSDKILAEIKTTRTNLSVSESLKTWFAEFFEHRRAVWIPASVAAAAACLTFAILPEFNAVPTNDNLGTNTGVVLHSAAPPKRGSQIAAVDFGEESGMQYTVDDGTGTTVGVVWIEEK